MEIRRNDLDNGVTVLAIAGRLDFLTAGKARTDIAAAVEAGHRNLVVDLAETPFIDSSGIGALIGGLKSARTRGGDLRIARPTTQARTVFSLTSLDKVFRQYDSIEEASAGF